MLAKAFGITIFAPSNHKRKRGGDTSAAKKKARAERLEQEVREL
jgi:hypothetical protein